MDIWASRIPVQLQCGYCHISILSGYCIPGKDTHICSKCFDMLKEANQKQCVAFKNEPCKIDSRYVASAISICACLQSNPCQHSRVQLSLRREIGEKSHGLMYERVYFGSDGMTIAKIGLMSENLNSISDHFKEYLSEIPIVKPGDTVTIWPGFEIIAWSGYVDPRTAEKQKLDEAWAALQTKWKQPFASELETFKEQALNFCKDVASLKESMSMRKLSDLDKFTKRMRNTEE